MPPQYKPRTNPTILQHARDNRHPQTPAEAKLWQLIRNRNLDGYKFRRQHPIGYYIVDFYCHESKLIVEVDGRSHDNQIAYDEQRTTWLQSEGFRVIRFTNEQVMRNVVSVTEEILKACREVEPQEPSP